MESSLSNFYRRNSNACWAIFLLVAHVATPSARGQQIPLFNATNMETNETFRSNFCQQHRQVELGVVPLRYALKGSNVRPALFRYQLDDETGGIDEVDPPLGIKILDEIARRAQFEWRDSYGVIDSPAGNQTWGDVLSWSLDTYDLNGDWFLRTTDRLADGILFPEHWYDGSLIMVRKVKEIGDDNFQLFALLSPFTKGVWILSIAITILSGLVYYAIEYIGSDGDPKKMKVTLRESVFQTFLNMTGHSLFDPKQPGTRLITFSSCFLFLVLLASYTANLTSFLVVKNSPDLVINDIQDVIKNNLRVCVLRSSTSETFLRERYVTARLVEKESIEQSYLGLDSEECDVVLTTTGTWMKNKGNIEYNKDCRKEWVGRVVQPNDAGFTIRDSAELCSSLVRDVFSLHLLEMKRDKTYNTIWNSKVSVTNNCQDIEASEDDAVDAAKMNMKNLGGIFVFHAITMVVGLALTVFSKHQKKRRLKNASSRLSVNNSSVNNSSLKTAGATTIQLKSASASSSSNLDIDKNSSLVKEAEENGLSMARSDSKQTEYIAAIEKQIECMDAMKKQMEVFQEQLVHLKEGKTE
mmetsp:Transcript_38537/g.43171  ORF Transcript_38537/g.43171 Transcript_38537/m.43171 type:complete len:582 (+) Transcript_38537:128-1873(+)